MTARAAARFIVFEGGEACGKSTQARRLAGGLDALLTREPGGTDVGRRLREVLLDPATGSLDARTEALLMAADRAEHVATVVRPALDAGRHVVSDRFSGSSVAYQGYGRGLPVAWVRELSVAAAAGIDPDLVVLLDVPVAAARARLVGSDLDRFEREDGAFHERVADGFRAQAAEAPERWVVVDGSAAVDDVEAAVRAAVADRLQLTW